MRTFMIAALVAAVFAQDAQSPCATAREEALAKEDPSVFVPECQPDGSFAPQQCTDISEDEEECWCVDVTGQKLDVDVSECEMCSLMYKAMVAQEVDDMYLPDCDDDGSFASVQCFGEDCYCCDAWTGQLDADLTQCEDDEDDEDEESQPCFEEYKLGVLEGDLWLPTCNDDGTYAARQCFEETCYCYDADTGDLTPDLTACPVEEDVQTTEGTQEATENNEEATDATENNEEATDATENNEEITEATDATENNEEAAEATDANVETTENNEEATDAAAQMIGDDIATDDEDEEEDEDENEGFSMGPSVAGAAILGVAMVGIASFVVVKRRSQESDASAYTMQV